MKRACEATELEAVMRAAVADVVQDGEETETDDECKVKRVKRGASYPLHRYPGKFLSCVWV